jgi:hypothetical protein
MTLAEKGSALLYDHFAVTRLCRGTISRIPNGLL